MRRAPPFFSTAFSGCILSGCILSGCILSGCILVGCISSVVSRLAVPQSPGGLIPKGKDMSHSALLRPQRHINFRLFCGRAVSWERIGRRGHPHSARPSGGA
ncbi:pentapeptide repeat-containing protein [Bacilliculturomica massiliensis]|uniref:pentapeptide repeat-containing protein n=1 Tax=Bacilliculturomica massiliensis TaxID=1917867 RepID=UPI00102FAA4F